MKSLMAAAVAAGVVTAAALPASASTFVSNSVCNSTKTSCTISEGLQGTTPDTSQFNLARGASLPAKNVKFTDFYTFSVLMGTEIDASFTLSGTGLGSKSTKPTGLDLALYMGTVGSGSYTGYSTSTVGSSIDATLTGGNYYLQVTGTSAGSSGGYGGTASFSLSSVPLPNSVALLGMAIVGLGVAGAARRRVARPTAA